MSGLGPIEPRGWIAGARRCPSPNVDARPPAVEVDLLLVHYVSLPPGRFAGDAIERLFTNTLDPAAHPAFADLAEIRVSAHLLIRRRGELLQFAGCDARAWHAGVSRLGDRTACNDFSIGVELEGDDRRPFTAAQYRRLGQVAGLLRSRYPLRWIAGHEDVAPGRKFDPGPRFDWARALAQPGLAGLRRHRGG